MGREGKRDTPVTRIDYQRARQRDKAPKQRSTGPKLARKDRQQILSAFVAKHGLACFKCATKTAEWAKTGTTNGRNWAICLPCVKKQPRVEGQGQTRS